MEGIRYMNVVLLLAYKICIQNYLEKILNSSLSPPILASQHIQCMFSRILGIHTGYLWHLILVWLRGSNSLLPQYTDHPSHTWNLRQHTIQLVLLNLLKHRGHKKPFLIPCSEPWLRTSSADGLPGGEKTAGTLQGKNCICSGSRKGYSASCFPILLGKSVLFWIEFNHSKEKEIKFRFYWDGQCLHLNPIVRSYKVG